MEKKRIWIIVCASVVVAAVIGIAIFLIVTSSVQPTSPSGAPENIDGTWRVAAFTPNVTGDEKPSYVDNQEMVLENGTFSYRQNGTVIATAKYTFTSGSKDYSSTISVPHYRCSLELKEWSLDGLPSLLVVKYYTENIVEFVDEMSGRMWRLVHIDGARDEQPKVTTEYLHKKWTVVLKGYQAPDMTLEFSADKLKVERAEGPMELPYTFDAEKQTLDIPAFGLAHIIIPGENQLAFALEEKTQEITLWELKLA